tara:strand:+ start:6668 stop:6904 length:237 start_codon:yes stop_codon:yes gene_type:complete
MDKNKLKILFKIIEDVLGAKKGTVDIDSNADTIDNWDSINIVNLMIAIEENYEFSMTIEEAIELTSVKKIISLIERND